MVDFHKKKLEFLSENSSNKIAKSFKFPSKGVETLLIAKAQTKFQMNLLFPNIANYQIT